MKILYADLLMSFQVQKKYIMVKCKKIRFIKPKKNIIQSGSSDFAWQHQNDILQILGQNIFTFPTKYIFEGSRVLQTTHCLHIRNTEYIYKYKKYFHFTSHVSYTDAFKNAFEKKKNESHVIITPNFTTDGETAIVSSIKL